MDCVDWAPDVWKCSQKIATKIRPFRLDKMDVSENSGTPKSSILIGFSIINHPFWGIPIFGETSIYEHCYFHPAGSGSGFFQRRWILYCFPMQSWHEFVSRLDSSFRELMIGTSALPWQQHPKMRFFVRT